RTDALLAAMLQIMRVERNDALRGLATEFAEAVEAAGDVVRRQPAIGGVHREQFARRRPGTAGRLCEQQHHVVALVEQCALDEIDREAAEPRQRYHGLFEFLRARRGVHARFAGAADTEPALGLTS